METNSSILAWRVPWTEESGGLQSIASVEKTWRQLKQLSRHASVSSVTQSHLTLCDAMDCSTPSFPVHHQQLELTQTHVH